MQRVFGESPLADLPPPGDLPSLLASDPCDVQRLLLCQASFQPQRQRAVHPEQDVAVNQYCALTELAAPIPIRDRMRSPFQPESLVAADPHFLDGRRPTDRFPEERSIRRAILGKER